MERRQQEAAIEAVLFAMGESVEIDKLAEVIEEKEETARQIIADMKDKWEKEGRGFPLWNLKMPIRCVPEGTCMNICSRWPEPRKNMF